MRAVVSFAQFIWFLREAVKAYRNSRGQRFAFNTLSRRGVPYLAVLVAREREAWRLDDMLIRYCAERGVKLTTVKE